MICGGLNDISALRKQVGAILGALSVRSHALNVAYLPKTSSYSEFLLALVLFALYAACDFPSALLVLFGASGESDRKTVNGLH